MKMVAVIIGLILICSDFIEKSVGSQLQGSTEPAVQSECRDRYLWVRAVSSQAPQFEAVDENGVHPISDQLAPLCGYTISSFKMDGSTTFRASYYSCFTQNQNDEVFTFRLNVMVSDATGQWISQPVSAVCPGLIWTHREITCEEDYMEVNVNRDSSCGGLWGGNGQVWQAALSQARRTASSVWQLMILKSDGQVSSMSVSEAERRGFSLSTSARRIVLRSLYKQPHAELTMVDGIPVEVVRVSLFSKQKLTVVMIDVSMACTVNPGSFDGAQLLWDIPLALSPLIGEGPGFESQSLSLGVEGVLLDEPTSTTRGFSLVQDRNMVQIRVPFGAEGGYRKSLVVNNTYKEMYVIFLLYEHVFSLLFEDGSSIDTKHRMLRVLDTPLLCRQPFSLDQTSNDDQGFRVYLGNIPADVVLQEVWINKKQLTPQSAGQGLSIKPVVNTNGSRAYELQLPFEDPAVHWMYLGQGVVQYSININFTLTIMPQRDFYFHDTSLTARVSNAFPPEITAQCSDRGISFSVVRPPRAESLWEVGIDHEPLTSELAAQRGYHLYTDTHRTTLEVPVFSVGYTYEDINLSNFYGTFQLLLRDSKTLEVQTSTSKRCLFKTQDMIVCSKDGTMTVVTTPTSTWPAVQPERTSLLDPSCGPKQMDGFRALFEFKLNSCGTRAMVGESYMVYENEILHDRQLITDGPNFISRESQFKLTVRCFYPLSGVGRLSVDRMFRSDTPGIGSVKVFKSLKDSENEIPSQYCLQPSSGSAANTPTNQAHQNPDAGNIPQQFAARPWLKPGLSHYITMPGRHNKLLHFPQNFPNLQLLPPHKLPLLVSSPAGNLKVQTTEQHNFRSPTENQLHHRFGKSTDSRVQLSNLNTQSHSFGEARQENPGLTKDHLGLGLSPLGTNPGPSPERFAGNLGSSRQSFHQNVWPSGLARDQPTQNSLIQEVAKTEEVPGYQPQRPYDPFQATQLHPVLEPPAHYNTENTRNKGGSVSTALTGQDNQSPGRPGSVERRNVNLGQSRVQNIRVKPQSKFVPSGHTVNYKPVIQQADRQVSNSSHYATGLNADRGDGNHWTSQRPSDHGGSSTREHVPDTTQTQELVNPVTNQPRPKQELAHLIPNQPEPQQKLYYPVLNQPGPRQTFIQPTGVSHIRVRPVSGLQERFPTPHEPKQQNLQNPSTHANTRGNTSRTPIFSLAPQSVPNTPTNIREYQPHYPRQSERSPAASTAGNPGSYPGHNGSGSPGSDLKIHTRPDCSQDSQYGANVHQGIIRGTQKRFTHT